MTHFSLAFLVLLCTLSIHPLTAFGGELALIETEDTLHITQRGKPVLDFVKTARPVPEGVEQHFSRSGYIHPVYTPSGQEISGDYSPEHAHQHALFFSWTKTTFAGKKVDFWNQAKQQANVEFREVISIDRKETQISFCVKLAYVVGHGDDKVDALEDIWTVTVYQSPEEYFLFDLQSEQSCASEEPLVLEEYHYGGMAFRGNAQWLKQPEDKSINPGDLQFLTSEGKDRWDGNHTRPNWVAMTGQIDGQNVSLAAFCSPENFRAPQHVRLHPFMPYFCFTPVVEGAFQIEPGQKYISRYRFLVTSEAASKEMINTQWQRYVESSR